MAFYPCVSMEVKLNVPRTLLLAVFHCLRLDKLFVVADAVF